MLLWMTFIYPYSRFSSELAMTDELAASCSVDVERCAECGQPLGENYAPPADEEWSSGICGCAEDRESCKTGLLCPCVLFGRNCVRIRKNVPYLGSCTYLAACACHACLVEGGIAAAILPCFLNVEVSTAFSIWEVLLLSWWICGIYTGLCRKSLQKKYHLKKSPCHPCIVHCCLHFCALCQEHRELKSRLANKVTTPKTKLNPPAVQKMSGTLTKPAASSENGSSGEKASMEMRPL